MLVASTKHALLLLRGVFSKLLTFSKGHFQRLSVYREICFDAELGRATLEIKNNNNHSTCYPNHSWLISLMILPGLLILR